VLQKHDVQVGLVVYYQKGFFSTQAYMLVCAAKTYVLQKRYVLQKFVYMCCKNITSKSVSLLTVRNGFFSIQASTLVCAAKRSAAKDGMYVLQKHDVQVRLLVNHQMAFSPHKDPRW